MKSVIIHYGEIALKGKNRPWFVARLVKNIREATSDLDIAEVRVLMGRIELVLGPERDLGTGRATASAWCSASATSRGRDGRALDVDAIATEILKDLGPGESRPPSACRPSARTSAFP